MSQELLLGDAPENHELGVVGDFVFEVSDRVNVLESVRGSPKRHFLGLGESVVALLAEVLVVVFCGLALREKPLVALDGLALGMVDGDEGEEDLGFLLIVVLVTFCLFLRRRRRRRRSRNLFSSADTYLGAYLFVVIVFGRCGGCDSHLLSGLLGLFSPLLRLGVFRRRRRRRSDKLQSLFQVKGVFFGKNSDNRGDIGREGLCAGSSVLFCGHCRSTGTSTGTGNVNGGDSN